MIQLKEVNVNNYWEIIELTVKASQKEFVTSNAVSLGQAYVQKECIPLAIYNEEQPVGFLMYCIDREDGEYWIYRLMIDKRYQGKGYAKEAMQQLIHQIKQDTSHHKIYLGVDLRGDISVKLYKSLGFEFTGQEFGKEHIMVLQY